MPIKMSLHFTDFTVYTTLRNMFQNPWKPYKIDQNRKSFEHHS